MKFSVYSEKEHSTRTEASESLGALLLAASIPLMLTFGLRGQIKEDQFCILGLRAFILGREEGFGYTYLVIVYFLDAYKLCCSSLNLLSSGT